MREQGTVVAVRPGAVDLVMTPGDGCGDCTACSASGTNLLLEGVPAPDGLHVGDVVDVETPQAERTRARALVFVVPVVALVLGYVAGFLLGAVVPVSRDSLGAVMALTCGALTFALVAKLGSRVTGGTAVRVRVRAIISQAERPLGEEGPGNEGTEEDQTRE